MKAQDPLLAAWEETLARKRDAPAIFNPGGEVVSSFLQIEERARAIEAKMPTARPHNVNAIQIGNHEDWPPIFLACLRTQRVVLPIDESVGKEQADTAVSIAAKSGIIDWGNKPPTLFKLTSGTTAQPRIVRFRSEQLLAAGGQCRAKISQEIQAANPFVLRRVGVRWDLLRSRRSE